MRSFHGVAATAVALFIAAAPAQAANTTLTTLTESQNFPALQSTVKYTRHSTTSASGMGNYARATSQVQYNHATGSYTIRDTGSLTLKSTFGAANITSSSAAFNIYSKGSNETLRLYKPGTTTQGIALTYTGYGHWRRTGTPSFGTGTAVNDTYLVYGLKTPAANIPTGSASYTTALDGTFTNKTGVYAITGNGNLTANFTAASITYSATLAGAREGDSAALAGLGALTGGQGTIALAGSMFRSTTPATGGGYRLDTQGYFFGPAAQEVGGVFRLQSINGNGQGAMVGKQ